MNPFLDGALELVARLDGSRDQDGVRLLLRAEALVEEFESWLSRPPDGTRKSSAISELIDLTREVNELLVQRRDDA